jgi:hypothetical protein
MPNLNSIARLFGALFVLTAAATAASISPGHAAGAVLLQCAADGAGDISLNARYEERPRARTRRKFSAEFEAAPGGNFRAGQVMTVLVKGTAVGNATLKKVVGGDLVGDLNLDTNADSPDEKPFPANFPQVERNTNVTVKINGGIVLGCRLQ